MLFLPKFLLGIKMTGRYFDTDFDTDIYWYTDIYWGIRGAVTVCLRVTDDRGFLILSYCIKPHIIYENVHKSR